MIRGHIPIKPTEAIYLQSFLKLIETEKEIKTSDIWKYTWETELKTYYLAIKTKKKDEIPTKDSFRKIFYKLQEALKDKYQYIIINNNNIYLNYETINKQLYLAKNTNKKNTIKHLKKALQNIIKNERGRNDALKTAKKFSYTNPIYNLTKEEIDIKFKRLHRDLKNIYDDSENKRDILIKLDNLMKTIKYFY
jgi:hypothetical protein